MHVPSTGSHFGPMSANATHATLRTVKWLILVFSAGERESTATAPSRAPRTGKNVNLRDRLAPQFLRDYP